MRKISDAGIHTRIFQADGTTESGVKAAFAFAEKEFGYPTAAVNCLGNVFLKPVHRSSAAEFSEVMKLHVFSSFLILKEACGHMKAESSIALISSVAVQTGLPNHESIAPAKGAVEGLIRSAAATYAPKGIRFTGQILHVDGELGNLRKLPTGTV